MYNVTFIRQNKSYDHENHTQSISGSEALSKSLNRILEKITKQRADARQKLIKTIDPILKDYIQQNGITLLIDKKYVDGEVKNWKNEWQNTKKNKKNITITDEMLGF